MIFKFRELKSIYNNTKIESYMLTYKNKTKQKPNQKQNHKLPEYIIPIDDLIIIAGFFSRYHIQTTMDRQASQIQPFNGQSFGTRSEDDRENMGSRFFLSTRKAS